MLAKIPAESNDFLKRITESRIETEKEIRLLHEQLEAAGIPPGSIRPSYVPPGNLTTKEERDAMKLRADALAAKEKWTDDDLGNIHAAIWPPPPTEAGEVHLKLRDWFPSFVALRELCELGRCRGLRHNHHEKSGGSPDVFSRCIWFSV
jgi:hypothetical protein